MSKKIKLYSDDIVDVYTKELDMKDFQETILRILDVALIWANTYSQLAKNPIELRKLIKKDILNSIQITEDIIKWNIKK